jgi:glycosyltransferase involved in cell wall biosynthesis
VIVLQANFAFDARILDADQLLDQYATLTGWSEALLEAGAARVVVQQRFHRRAALMRNGVEYRFVDSWTAPSAHDGRFDIAHANGLGFPGRIWQLRRLLPRPTAIVVQDHAGGPPPDNVVSRLFTRRGLREVDGFLFTATEQAEPWQAATVIAERQTVYEVLESSTRLRPIPRGPARTASGVEGAPALLWVGRLNANKDPLTVLGGFEQVVGTLPGARLTMVFGTDDLLTRVRARVDASPALANRVRLVGRVAREDLPAYYSAADIFVLGSHHEGSGYALLEACACGAVPVVTSIPPFRTITGANGLGRLWAPDDGAAMARAVCDVASGDLGAQRAAVALHFARALSWPAVGRRALEIYREVVARRRGSLQRGVH